MMIGFSGGDESLPAMKGVDLAAPGADETLMVVVRDGNGCSEYLSKELQTMRRHLESRLKDARSSIRSYTSALEVARNGEVEIAQALARLDELMDREGIARPQEAAAPAGGVEDPAN